MIPRVTHTRLPEGRQDFKLDQLKGGGEKLRLQQVPMNLETGFDRCGHLVPCRNGWLL